MQDIRFRRVVDTGTVDFAPHEDDTGERDATNAVMTETHPHPFVVVRNGAGAPGDLRNAVVAIGNFDGVHRGHRAVIETAVARARKTGKPAAALTFEPHPRSFFQPNAPSFRLT